MNICISENTEFTTEPIIVKEVKKRGRKPKKICDNIQDSSLNILTTDNECLTKQSSTCSQHLEIDTENKIKKRGRRSKGCKIVTTDNISSNKEFVYKLPNIIIHLKCSLNDINNEDNIENKDLEYYNIENNCLDYDKINNDFEGTFYNNNYYMITDVLTTSTSQQSLEVEQIKDNSVDYKKSYIISHDNLAIDTQAEVLNQSVLNTKEIWKKIKLLEQQLYLNNYDSNKKSACFWCTCDYSNPSIHIPKFILNEIYNVYGSFCSPECACAFLMKEQIDNSTKFERYQLLNQLYSKIYKYSKNIKPAPDPHYTLDKFFGTLNIQEYRSLLQNDRLFLVVDKPLTLIMCELIEDNDDYVLNKKIIPSNNSIKNTKKNAKTVF